MIGSAIVDRVTNDATATAIIGDRVYPRFAPQEQFVYPRIVYGNADGENEDSSVQHTFDGKVGVVHETVTISALARTRTAANDLGKRIRALFEGLVGTWGGYYIQGAFWERSTDKEFLLNDANQDAIVYSREVMIEFIYRET